MTDLSNTIIQTERLTLRPISLQFAEEMFKKFNDDITLYMYPKPSHDIAETIKYIKDAQLEIKNGTALTLCMTLKSTGEYIGNCGIHNINTTTPELGIWIKKAAHGNKYGQEALKGAKQWADTNLQYNYLTYPVAKENIPSRKIAESLGGVVKKEYQKRMLTGKKWDMVEYHISKCEL